MKIRLVIDVDASLEKLAAYYYQYHGFQTEDHETPAQTLFREAVAAWDMEGLFDGEPVLVSSESIDPAEVGK